MIITSDRLQVTSKEWTIIGILKKAEEKLKEKGVQNPRFDAEALLSNVLRVNKVGLYTEYDRILSNEEVSRFSGVIERRLRREPLQYILGSSEFFGLEFTVSPDVLIPRPETELLVEEALKIVSSSKFQVSSKDKDSPQNILDLCTGSGCIAIALAKVLKDSKMYAIDISGRALRVAKENARRHGVEEKIKFIQGDLYGPFNPPLPPFRKGGLGGIFDLIISNPPYIPSHEIDLLQSEVKDYEPKDALNGGPDGLLYLRKIIEEATAYLRSGGILLLEMGEGQRERICNIIENNGVYLKQEIIKDYAGYERVLVAVKR